MKRILPLLVLTLSLTAAAQPQREPSRIVTTANYELAERFSQKKVGQMVYSTRITPNWFAGSDRFWYSYKTSQGTKYYLVDPVAGKKSEIFDMDKLAMQITEITRDPYDAQHLPLRLELKEDKYFQFDIKSKTEKRDSTGKGTGKFVTYRFYWDIATKKLTWDTDEHNRKYPTWANVSPDGTKGIYVKNHDLYLMDSTSLRKAAKDEKDSTLVEVRLTTDGTAEFSWNGDNYAGDNETDSTKRRFAPVEWAPDSRKFATFRWDMSKVKPFWVINSVTEPRPTLETYHYQMPGEPGPKPFLYVMETEGKAQPVKVIAFKDQECGILSAPATARDRYKEFRGGHPNRSKWYHNYGYGNLRDYGLEDQKYAIRQLAARHPYIDINRVGIHGHSGGGFMSTAAILQYNDFFKAAVSCAGNHDNRIYNRWWSEQHHGVAEKIEKGDTTFVYKIETNPQIAARLKGHLMLVHGDIDNNVNPANSIRVANALIRANKRFEYVLLPGQRHGFGDMNDLVLLEDGGPLRPLPDRRQAGATHRHRRNEQ